MANYMVAVDNSLYSQWAFNLAIAQMDVKNDKLFVYTAARDLQIKYEGLSSTAYEYLKEHRNEETARCKRILRKYFGEAKKEGVTPTLLMGWSDHIGDALCKTVIEKKIHHLVLGRRNVDSTTRMFIGSATSFCLENAACNVFVAKRPFGPGEEHTPLEATKYLEEKERQRRLDEEEDRKLLDELERQATLIQVKAAEEKERRRRMRLQPEKMDTEEGVEVDLEIYDFSADPSTE
mmetsp:Transcript_23559/g.26131  ORF Transcript_23559/g.26131 Transcript_23559/m.26131 type:complete len:235 (+) Transcript_23559:105-809(+)|eukprot:CAMPEP_0168529572 /NCGR_PEP_ID=MMETSP0405-20121227/14009_1 /TAXON_ID=498012 /ORGANISM="Trichosphaerium sp, Strain Am-I-7 wt" /LENGTH=234 /DNA_ID=CAMNT_0008553363 /DNA_START=42 /DNA_END=746 /DNA_ORIENTATION=-